MRLCRKLNHQTHGSGRKWNKKKKKKENRGTADDDDDGQSQKSPLVSHSEVDGDGMADVDF